MRMNKFCVAAIAATTFFASCSEENSTDKPNVLGEEAKMTIRFDNPSAVGTKAFDETPETVIESATAFVLTADGAIMKRFAVDVDDEDKEYPVTTAANKVVIVANEDLSSSVSLTLADLKKEVAALQALDGANGFFASGTSDVLVFDQPSVENAGSSLAKAVVTLTLLPAKLNVAITNEMTNYDVDKGLVLEDVAVLYSAGYSQWVATTENGTDFYPSVATIAGISNSYYFLSGFTGWDTDDSDQNAEYDDLLRAWDDAVYDSANPFEETFYVYPTLPEAQALAYDKNTILVIRAIWKGVDGTEIPEPRYFPVHFSTTDVGELVSGNEYAVSITLKGDANTGGGSVTDPEEEIIPAYINVSVSISAWNPVTIDKVFE